MTPFEGHFFEDSSNSNENKLQLSPTVKLQLDEVPMEVPMEVPTKVPMEVPIEVPIEVPTEVPTKVPMEGESTSAKPGLRSGSERMFVVDCRSNSLASEEKEDTSNSLFGEREKEKEVLYTNFNEIFKQDVAGTSQYVGNPMLVEKEIQEASQQILTPKIDARPPSDGKKLLDGLLQTETSKLWGTSFLSKGLSNVGRRINLEFSDEEQKSGSKLAVSLIDSEDGEENKKWGKEEGVMM